MSLHGLHPGRVVGFHPPGTLHSSLVQTCLQPGCSRRELLLRVGSVQVDVETVAGRIGPRRTKGSRGRPPMMKRQVEVQPEEVQLPGEVQSEEVQLPEEVQPEELQPEEVQEAQRKTPPQRVSAASTIEPKVRDFTTREQLMLFTRQELGRPLTPAEVVLVCNQLSKLCEPAAMNFRAWLAVQAYNEELTLSIQDSMLQLAAYDLVVLMSALGRMHFRPSTEWIQAFFEASQPHLAIYGPRFMCFLIRALSRLDAKVWHFQQAPAFSPWIKELLEVAQAKVWAFRGDELVSLLRALADLAWRPSDEWLTTFSQAIRRKLEFLPPPLLSSVLVALTFMRRSHNWNQRPMEPVLMRDLGDQLAAKLPMFDDGDLATAAQSLGMVRRMVRLELFTEFMLEAARKSDGFRPATLANMIGALSDLVSARQMGTCPSGALILAPPPNPSASPSPAASATGAARSYGTGYGASPAPATSFSGAGAAATAVHQANGFSAHGGAPVAASGVASVGSNTDRSSVAGLVSSSNPGTSSGSGNDVTSNSTGLPSSTPLPSAAGLMQPPLMPAPVRPAPPVISMGQVAVAGELWPPPLQDPVRPTPPVISMGQVAVAGELWPPPLQGPVRPTPPVISMRQVAVAGELWSAPVQGPVRPTPPVIGMGQVAVGGELHPPSVQSPVQPTPPAVGLGQVAVGGELRPPSLQGPVRPTPPTGQAGGAEQAQGLGQTAGDGQSSAQETSRLDASHQQAAGMAPSSPVNPGAGAGMFLPMPGAPGFQMQELRPVMVAPLPGPGGVPVLVPWQPINTYDTSTMAGTEPGSAWRDQSSGRGGRDHRNWEGSAGFQAPIHGVATSAGGMVGAKAPRPCASPAWLRLMHARVAARLDGMTAEQGARALRGLAVMGLPPDHKVVEHYIQVSHEKLHNMDPPALLNVVQMLAMSRYVPSSLEAHNLFKSWFALLCRAAVRRTWQPSLVCDMVSALAALPSRCPPELVDVLLAETRTNSPGALRRASPARLASLATALRVMGYAPSFGFLHDYAQALRHHWSSLEPRDLAAVLTALAAFDPTILAMDQAWLSEMLVMVQCKLEKFESPSLAAVLAAAVSLGSRPQRVGPAGPGVPSLLWYTAVLSRLEVSGARLLSPHSAASVLWACAELRSRWGKYEDQQAAVLREALKTAAGQAEKIKDSLMPRASQVAGSRQKPRKMRPTQTQQAELQEQVQPSSEHPSQDSTQSQIQSSQPEMGQVVAQSAPTSPLQSSQPAIGPEGEVPIPSLSVALMHALIARVENAADRLVPQQAADVTWALTVLGHPLPPSLQARALLAVPPAQPKSDTGQPGVAPRAVQPVFRVDPRPRRPVQNISARASPHRTWSISQQPHPQQPTTPSTQQAYTAHTAQHTGQASHGTRQPAPPPSTHPAHRKKQDQSPTSHIFQKNQYWNESQHARPREDQRTPQRRPSSEQHQQSFGQKQQQMPDTTRQRLFDQQPRSPHQQLQPSDKQQHEQATQPPSKQPLRQQQSSTRDVEVPHPQPEQHMPDRQRQSPWAPPKSSVTSPQSSVTSLQGSNPEELPQHEGPQSISNKEPVGDGDLASLLVEARQRGGAQTKSARPVDSSRSAEGPVAVRVR